MAIAGDGIYAKDIYFISASCYARAHESLLDTSVTSEGVVSC